MNREELLLLIEQAVHDALVECHANHKIVRILDSIQVLQYKQNGEIKRHAIRVKDVNLKRRAQDEDEVEQEKSDAQLLEEEQKGRDREMVDELNRSNGRE